MGPARLGGLVYCGSDLDGIGPFLGACPGNSKKRSGQGASSSIRWTV
jgi:hypothetical protein